MEVEAYCSIGGVAPTTTISGFCEWGTDDDSGYDENGYDS